MIITFWSLSISAFLMFFTGAAFSLIGVGIGGMLVLRSRGGAYEPIFPPLKAKEEVAVNLDGFDEVPQNSLTAEDLNAEFEKMFTERAEEAENNPIKQANAKMKEQMDGQEAAL